VTKTAILGSRGGPAQAKLFLMPVKPMVYVVVQAVDRRPPVAALRMPAVQLLDPGSAIKPVQRLQLQAGTLKAEHEQMAAQWPQIQADLRAVQEHQGFSPRDLAGLSRRWAEFATLYADHIQREDTQAYPIARLQLEEARLTSMARDMARLRGVQVSR